MHSGVLIYSSAAMVLTLDAAKWNDTGGVSHHVL